MGCCKKPCSTKDSKPAAPAKGTPPKKGEKKTK